MNEIIMLKPIRKNPFLSASLMGVASLCLFILIACLDYFTQESAIRSVEIRKRHFEALLASRDLLSQLKDIETGQRGYAITGEDRFLEPYDQAMLTLDETQKDFDKKISVIPNIELIGPHIHKLIEEFKEISARVIVLRQTAGFPGVQELNEDSKEAMDALRITFHGLDQHIWGSIKKVRENVAFEQRRALAFNLLMLLGGSALMIAAFIRLYVEQQRRIRLQAELTSMNNNLETLVQQRTAELEQAREEIFRFASELASSIEEERARLSREVHDQLGQVFTAIKMSFSTMDKSKYQALLGDNFEVLNANLDHGVAVARRIAADLRPPMLDDLGLGAAIQHHCNSHTSGSGLTFAVDVNNDHLLSQEQNTQLFRITQEAVTNVMRHAKASQVKITDRLTAEAYQLDIEDNGQGLQDKNDGRISLGRLGMRERAEIAGGETTIQSPEHGGVRVRITIPLHQK